MAPIQKQSNHSKCFLAISIVIITVLLVFQINLPQLDNQNKATGIGRHEHKHHSSINDYEIFTSYPLPLVGATSEVPRVILGKEVRYIINNPICDSIPPNDNKEDNDVFMLILITSYVGDVKLRRKLREIVPQSQLDEIKVKRLFLLARPPPSFQVKDVKYAEVAMKEIYRENQEFRDILMGDFIESYKQLTYKHLMGLEWAATFCQNAKFVLKQDDDIAVDYFQLYGMLSGNEKQSLKLRQALSDPDSRTIYGKILKAQPVNRDPESKWYVSPEEYSYSTYPPYVSGWAYVTTISTIQELLRASEHEQYFFVDDAFVTGILREKTHKVVDLIDMSDHFTNFKGQLLCCVSVPMFAKSKNNEPFWCDYIVGPSNDDLELMEVYHRHSQYCFVSKQCRRRDDTELLARKCVITGNMKIQDFSQLHSQVKAKPLPVIRKQ